MKSLSTTVYYNKFVNILQQMESNTIKIDSKKAPSIQTFVEHMIKR